MDDAFGLLCRRTDEYLHLIGRPLTRDQLTSEGYTPFKTNNRIVVAVVMPGRRRPMRIAFKMTRQMAAQNTVTGFVTMYDENHEQVLYDIVDPNIDLS